MCYEVQMEKRRGEGQSCGEEINEWRNGYEDFEVFSISGEYEKKVSENDDTNLKCTVEEVRKEAFV